MLDLSERIREFVDGAEDPVTIFDVGAILEGRPTRQRRLRPLLITGGAVTAVAATLLAAILIPTGQKNPSVAAAAELHQIAANASNQKLPRLGKGQWLSTEQTVSFAGHVTQVGATVTPNAKATIGATIKLWSDAYGDACIMATSGAAQFATPANQAAWQAAGMLDSPTGQPITDCESVVGGSFTGRSPGGGPTVLDVSRLPTNPSKLAHELESGTTGIESLDRLATGETLNPGFERAAILFIGPTTGATPAFNSALFDALALIPGIRDLGDMTAHSGSTGIAFSGASILGTSIVIIDPSTGSLLEARNILSPATYTGIGASYLAPPPTPSIGTQGGSGGGTIQWLDPIGSPRVVTTSSLPSDLVVPKQIALTGTIAATAKLNVSYVQLEDLQNQLDSEYGPTYSGGYVAPSSVQDQSSSSPVTVAGGAIANTGAVLDWTFTGPKTQLSHYLAALKASGLFSSVKVSEGHTSP